MALKDLSPYYTHSAQLIQERIRLLRRKLRQTDDPEEKWHIKREITVLTPILTQMRELAELTEHYYDRGFWRNEKYTV